MPLEKTYDPAAAEGPRYEAWEQANAFAANPASAADPYVIMMPPPNVTGSLHMGHALTFTLQDVLIRYNRMTRQGRALAARHGPRWHRDADGGRAPTGRKRRIPPGSGPREVPGRVWEWKGESGGDIMKPADAPRRFCDWARERFTMDEGLSAAVRKVFVELYDQGLIYSDKRLVNWDPKLQTAISDLEVAADEANGHALALSSIRLKARMARTSRSPRPGPKPCWAIPALRCIRDDERYSDLVGKHCDPAARRPSHPHRRR